MSIEASSTSEYPGAKVRELAIPDVTVFGGDSQMDQVCWICGNKADSAEHRIKKSDLVRAHGTGPYQGPAAVVHFQGGKETLIQGPRSNAIKYQKSLCQHCNTTYTQPFDHAYDGFIDWIMQNEQLVLHRMFIDFSEIFGSGWKNEQRGLYKYFAKSFGCRLINAGVDVPADVVTLFGKNVFRTALRLTVAINKDVLLLPPHVRNGFIGKGELLSLSPRHTPGLPIGFVWDEHVSWLTIGYWYNCLPTDNFPTWVADQQFIHLGVFYPLDGEMRTEFLEKVKNSQ